MADKILHKRNLTSGNIPTTSSLDAGELAINVADATVFIKQSGSNSQTIRSLLTLDVPNSGSINLSGSITASYFFGTASWAQSASVAISSSYIVPTGLPNGVVSSSTQINTGSFTGSFTGILIGTSSWASSASVAISSSFALSASWAPGGAGTVGPGTVNYIPKFTTTTTIGDSSLREDGTYIISSLPISASSFTGSLFGTASWATNAVSASWAPISAIQSSSLSIDQYSFTSDGATTNYVLSKSYLDTSLFVMVDGLVFNLADDYTFNSGTSTLSLLQAPPSQSVIYVRGFMNVAQNATGSYYGAFNGTFSGSFNVTASAAVSSSYALTASYALNAGGGSGTVTSVTAGDGLSGGVITTAGTISLNTSSLHFTDGVKKKLNTDGVISSSLQINTGSFSGSFTGTLIGTSSWVQSASIAITSSYIIPSGLPTGVVSSSVQINTGSFSGSFTGTLNGTSSYANNALSSSYALTASYALNGGSGGGSITTTTITRTLTLSSGYASILSASENVLTNGTYMLSSVLNDGTFSNYRLSGTFSWYSGSYSVSEYDEIFLHRMGRSASSASVFMRTRTVSGSDGYLEIGCDYTLSPNSYTFTFARII